MVKWLENKEKKNFWKFNMFEPPVLLWDSPDYLVTVVMITYWSGLQL